MIKKIMFSLVISFLVSTNTTAQPNQQVEVFDISKSEVVMEVQLNSDIQLEVEMFLQGITDVYRKLDPIPKSGFMVKIPLEPAYLMHNEWLNDLIDKVIVMFPSKEKPYLMVFDNENSPHFFIFEGKTDRFLRKLLKLGPIASNEVLYLW